MKTKQSKREISAFGRVASNQTLNSNKRDSGVQSVSLASLRRDRNEQVAWLITIAPMDDMALRVLSLGIRSGK
jgi:hypothetical protein